MPEKQLGSVRRPRRMPLPTASSVWLWGTTAPVGGISISMRPPDMVAMFRAQSCSISNVGRPAVSEVWNVH